MTISWPSSLSNKLFSVSGYSEDAYTDPSVRSQMDSGPPKARARYTFVPKKIEGILDTLTSTDVDNLITFFETTCSMGSLTFQWTHPRTGATKTFMWMKYPQISPANGAPTIFAASLSLLMLN